MKYLAITQAATVFASILDAVNGNWRRRFVSAKRPETTSFSITMAARIDTKCWNLDIMQSAA